MCKLCDSLEFAPYEDLASKQNAAIEALENELKACRNIIDTQLRLIEVLQTNTNMERVMPTLKKALYGADSKPTNPEPPSWVNNTRYPVL